MFPARLLALVVALCLLPGTAAQAFRLPAGLADPAGNPADRLLGVAADPEVYDVATHCSARSRPGVVAMQAWLESHADGVFWGSYRCERWGNHSASLHAENRAIDWHPSSRSAARALIDMLLAPDQAGNAHALARRMGVEELIWDCSYWGAGMAQFERYSYCYADDGKRKQHLDPTAAHMNHVHIGFSKAGAAAQTSFWLAQHLGARRR